MSLTPQSIPPIPAHYQGVLALLGAVFLWGSTFVVTKTILQEVGPFTVTALRFLVGFMTLLPFVRRSRFQWRFVIQPRFLLFGLTGIVLYFGLQNIGLMLTSAGNAALIQASIPAATALFAYLLLKERLQRLQFVGVALSILGVLLVTWSMPSDSDGRALLGNLLIVGSVIAFAIYTIQGRKLTDTYVPIVSTTASFGAGLLLLLPMALIEMTLNGVPQISFSSWLNVLYLGCGASALTLFLWNSALRFIPASVAALYTSLIPVAGLLFAFLLGEEVSMLQMIGGALAMLGVWLGNLATHS